VLHGGEELIRALAALALGHPAYRFRDTQLETRGARTLEAISIETAGKALSVCFDITESFNTGRLR